MRGWGRNLLRTLQVAWVSARHLLRYRLRPRTASGESTGPLHLRDALEELSGVFIKLGQLLALQPDIVPPAYCNALFDLLDRVPAFGFEHVERTFVEDFGSRPDELFRAFERIPMAAASIGQVHIAEIEGRKYAVKVQRPDAEKEFGTDLEIFRTVMNAILRLRIRRLYWIVKIIQELTHWTNEELDYRCEARYMVALGRNASDSSRERVPEFVPELSSRRILTAEFLDGPTVLDYIRHLENPDHGLESHLQRIAFCPDDLARNVIENFVHDAFQYGLFHADLHPANLLILPNSVVGYVDFGITGSLSHYSRRQIVGLTLALTRADLEGMLSHFLRISTIDEFSDVETFRREFRRLSGDWYDPHARPPRLRRHFTRIMLELLRLSRQTGVFASPDSIRYLRSVISTEGLISQFAPAFEVAPYVESVCSDRLRKQALREWGSPSVADWLVSGARLLTEAPATVTAYLGPLSETESRTRALAGTGLNAARLRRRAFFTACVAVTASMLATFTQADPTVGWNLFTIELVTAAAAIALFVGTLGRLAGGSERA